MLLFNDKNINITSNLDIFFNYFLDFKDWNKNETEQDYYKAVATKVFDILSAEYDAKYGGAIHRYPNCKCSTAKHAQAGTLLLAV